VSEPVPSAKAFEDFAFGCALALVGLIVCCIVDGFDGISEAKSHTFRLVEDPGGFRGILIMKWGYPAILVTVAMIASGIGALVLKAPGKASRGQ
jgi:hypothetical protein